MGTVEMWIFLELVCGSGSAYISVDLSVSL